MAKSKTETTPPNFEEALSQLDAIVGALESESIPLEDLIQQYDRGMKLLATCQSQLETAKQRVEMIGQREEANANPSVDHPSENKPHSSEPSDELF